MIDWFTALIPCRQNPLASDKILKINPAGEVVYEIDCSTTVESSYSDKITVRCISRSAVLDGQKQNESTRLNKVSEIKETLEFPYMLRIDGNPSKWFQGHNVDGVFELPLVTDFLVNVCTMLKINDTDVYSRIILGDFKVSRIDVTFSYALRDLRDCKDWIRAAGQCFHSRYQSVKCYETTLMVGIKGDGDNQQNDGKIKGSRRSLLKIYAKGAEVKLKDFITKFGLNVGQKLYDFCQPLLRVECCFRAMYLKTVGLVYFRDFTEGKLMELFLKKRDSLELPENVELLHSDLKHLKARQLGVYELWLTGVNLRDRFAKGTLARYAKEFKAFGVNLYAPPRNVKRNNIIPMFRVLEATPAVMPLDLAHLIYSPNYYDINMLKAA